MLRIGGRDQSYNPKIIQVPNDPILKATLLEANKDFNDFARDFLLNTNILFKEIQKSHVFLYVKQQQEFEAQLKAREEAFVK